MAKPLPPHVTYTVVSKRNIGDCGVASLAMFLRRDYEEVLMEAAHVNRGALSVGLGCPDLVKIAKRLGVKTRWKRTIDWDDDHGVLWVTMQPDPGEKEVRQHLVLLAEGSIIDPERPVRMWTDPDEYMAYYSAVGNQILVKQE